MAEKRASTSPGSFGVRVQWTPKLIAWLVVLVVSLILILQNWDMVAINILFWELDIRLAWALIAAFVVGAVLGWAVPRLRSVRRHR